MIPLVWRVGQQYEEMARVGDHWYEKWKTNRAALKPLRLMERRLEELNKKLREEFGRGRWNGYLDFRYGYVDTLVLGFKHRTLLSTLFGYEALRFLRHLDLRPRNVDELREMLNVPQIRSVQFLSVGGGVYGSQVGVILAQSFNLQSLRGLNLHGRSFHRVSRRTLDKGEGRKIRDEGARALMESKTLRNLGNLVLSGNEISGDMKPILEKWASWRGIKLTI